MLITLIIDLEGIDGFIGGNQSFQKALGHMKTHYKWDLLFVDFNESYSRVDLCHQIRFQTIDSTVIATSKIYHV